MQMKAHVYGGCKEWGRDRSDKTEDFGASATQRITCAFPICPAASTWAAFSNRKPLIRCLRTSNLPPVT